MRLNDVDLLTGNPAIYNGPNNLKIPEHVTQCVDLRKFYLRVGMSTIVPFTYLSRFVRDYEKIEFLFVILIRV